MFKIGDKVRCINSMNYHHIKIGKTYKVQNIIRDNVYIFGRKSPYEKELFELAGKESSDMFKKYSKEEIMETLNNGVKLKNEKDVEISIEASMNPTTHINVTQKEIIRSNGILEEITRHKWKIVEVEDKFAEKMANDLLLLNRISTIEEEIKELCDKVNTLKIRLIGE